MFSHNTNVEPGVWSHRKSIPPTTIKKGVINSLGVEAPHPLVPSISALAPARQPQISHVSLDRLDKNNYHTTGDLAPCLPHILSMEPNPLTTPASSPCNPQHGCGSADLLGTKMIFKAKPCTWTSAVALTFARFCPASFRNGVGTAHS